MTGHVVRIVANKFFGFILCNETRREYFFHRDDFNGHWIDLEEDYLKFQVEVTFDEMESNKGPRACNVTRTDNGIVK